MSDRQTAEAEAMAIYHDATERCKRAQDEYDAAHMRWVEARNTLTRIQDAARADVQHGSE